MITAVDTFKLGTVARLWGEGRDSEAIARQLSVRESEAMRMLISARKGGLIRPTPPVRIGGPRRRRRPGH